MAEQKDYNKPLRSMILICSIRTEEAASDAIKNMLRIVKGDSKTLGNKSGTLSFKNKIDLLYDIDDLDKDDYTRCVKFMELRNQFMHNPKCNNFVDLESEAPEIISYLKSKFPNDRTEREASYFESFEQLWIRVLGKLLTLKLEYDRGHQDEFMRFVRAKTFDNFESIFKAANEKWRATRKLGPKPHPLLMMGRENTEQEVANFEYHLKMAFYDEQVKIVELVEQNQFTEKDIYKRRIDFHAEIRKKIEEEKNKKELNDKKETDIEQKLN